MAVPGFLNKALLAVGSTGSARRAKTRTAVDWPHLLAARARRCNRQTAALRKRNRIIVDEFAKCRKQNGTTSESYVGVTGSLAAPLRFPHGPPCRGAWEIKPIFSDLNGRLGFPQYRSRPPNVAPCRASVARRRFHF